METHEFVTKYSNTSFKYFFDNTLSLLEQEATLNKLLTVLQQWFIIDVSIRHTPNPGLPYKIILLRAIGNDFNQKDLKATTLSELRQDIESLLTSETKIEEEIENEDIKLILESNGIQSTSVKKIHADDLYVNSLRNKGFIQARTNLEISLWWHFNGERVIFIYGQGVYQLSSKEK